MKKVIFVMLLILTLILISSCKKKNDIEKAYYVGTINVDGYEYIIFNKNGKNVFILNNVKDE